MWNPLKALKEKFTGKTAAEEKPTPVEPKMAEAAAVASAGAFPDMKDIEKKGLLRQFFRHWKDPAFVSQLKAISEKMQAEGVNIKDQTAVKVWVEKHQKEISSGEFVKSPEKPKTFVKTGPEIGRNDPCACGSGKKYKKCCGAGK